MNENYKEWLKKADDDEQTCVLLLQHESFPSAVVCFHSQQMAEKYLKGYLTFKNMEFPKIHDIVSLLDKYFIPVFPHFQLVREETIILTDYAVLPRYPGDYFDVTENDAREAFEAAKKIKKIVLESISI